MFYLHEFGDFPLACRTSYDMQFYERWCREAYGALASHPECSLTPAGCNYAVAAVTLRCVSFAHLRLRHIADNICTLVRRCPHARVVMFDLSDGLQPPLRIPNAIVCRSAFHESSYTPGSNVAIPQFPRHHFDRPWKRASERPLLASFKGAMRPENNDIRTRLLRLNSEDGFLIIPANLGRNDIEFSPSGRAVEICQSGEMAYEDLLFSSTFALVPRGCGYSLGYRLIESLNAGCIPVILSDGHVLPFSEVLDYREWSIRVSERDVARLPSILRERLHDSDWMQEEAHRIYSEYFSSTVRIMNCIVAIVTKGPWRN